MTRKHLSTEERQRVRTLYFDGFLTKAQIQNITTYSICQINYAIRASSAKVKPRSGRPTRAALRARENQAQQALTGDSRASDGEPLAAEVIMHAAEVGIQAAEIDAQIPVDQILVDAYIPVDAHIPVDAQIPDADANT